MLRCSIILTNKIIQFLSKKEEDPIILMQLMYYQIAI